MWDSRITPLHFTSLHITSHHKSRECMPRQCLQSGLIFRFKAINELAGENHLSLYAFSGDDNHLSAVSQWQTWTTLGATPAVAVATNPSVMEEVRLAVRALSSSPGSARALLGTTTQLSWKYFSQISCVVTNSLHAFTATQLSQRQQKWSQDWNIFTRIKISRPVWWLTWLT